MILGHVGGILIPESVTGAAGISETMYHAAALTLGAVSGFMTLTGVAILIYRRRTTGSVFSATTRNDKGTYVLLVATLVAGLATTALGTSRDIHTTTGLRWRLTSDRFSTFTPTST